MEEPIENNEWLAKSRRNLLVVSLVLLVINIGEAELSSVNGLLFQFDFNSPERLNLLLFISTTFLLLRYYNNAAKYHEYTNDAWTSELMKDNFILPKFHGESEGVAYYLKPSEVIFKPQMNRNKPEITFKSRLFINARFSYNEEIEGHTGYLEASILKLLANRKGDYFRVVGMIFKYWFNELIKAPYSLYLYTPYFIGIGALYSYFHYL